MGDGVFPEVVFGTCPVCGGTGPDNPDPGDGFAPARDTVGNGYELVQYEGEWMCQMCRKRKIQHSESRIMSEASREEDNFRANAGFRNTMEG